MRDALKTVEILRPNHPVLMNVTGREENNPEKIKENLSLHLTHRVQWTASMSAFLQHIPLPGLLKSAIRRISDNC